MIMEGQTTRTRPTDLTVKSSNTQWPSSQTNMYIRYSENPHNAKFSITADAASEFTHIAS